MGTGEGGGSVAVRGCAGSLALTLQVAHSHRVPS